MLLLGRQASSHCVQCNNYNREINNIRTLYLVQNLKFFQRCVVLSFANTEVVGLYGLKYLWLGIF